MAAHVASCPDCQAALAGMRLAAERLQQAFATVQAADDLPARVLAEVGDWHEAAQARRATAVYALCTMLGFAGLALLALSPFGLVLRALLRLVLATLSGSMNALFQYSSNWWIWICGVSLIIFAVSIAGAVRLLRGMRNEAAT